MTHVLVVVESPNKVAKVSKCLGDGYKVVATIGHFRDFPEKTLGVDTTTFDCTYVVSAAKSSVPPKLKQAAAEATDVILATDADREGEAIAWHVAQVLGRRGLRRMRFTELTSAALKKALAAAGPIDQHLVDAQQARRVVDRLVGYQVSPLLSAFGPNHSAGRVQTATLHLVVQRELQREAFRPTPFWTLTALYAEGFSARNAAQGPDGAWAVARFPTQEAALQAEAAASTGPHRVVEVFGEDVVRKPKAPFTTSTLAQAASAQLGLTPKRTMELAQALFEKGAITYHRTDSPALSAEAVAMARTFLSAHYPTCLPDVPPSYAAKAEAQGAHEAIRPTSLMLPADITLTSDEATLFTLISNRFLASQCRPAVLRRTTARIDANGVAFLATGMVAVSPSYLAFLEADEESVEKPADVDGDATAALPPLVTGQSVSLKRLDRKADATKPPPRFTAATLVREMERTGIGRPSTYAATLERLFGRKYLDEEKKAVFPTPRGRVIDAALRASFPTLVETSYTAQLETQLDDVAAGRRAWKESLRGWYKPFTALLEGAPGALAAFYNAHAEWVDDVSGAPKPTGKRCPKCGAELLLKQGTKGAYLSCAARPSCDYSANPTAVASLTPCPTCNGVMDEDVGEYGAYARCLNKDCKTRVSLAKPTGHACPSCGEGQLCDRGAFLGCSRHPLCRFTVASKALERAQRTKATCPKCGRLFVEKKGPRGRFMACVGYPTCRHTEAVAAKAKQSTPTKGKSHA